MRRLVQTIVQALVLVALTRSGTARAETPFLATDIVVDPHESKNLYAPTTFGLLASRDGGGSWRWICEGAIGAGARSSPTYVVTPKGTLLGALPVGLALSRDGGCNFAFSQGQGTHVLSDVTVRPDGEIWGIASTGDGTRDNHLLVSKDDAQTFSVSGGPLDPKLALETIRISPSEPARIYLGARRESGSVLVASLDGGMSWVQRKIELGSGETGARVEAVDPKNPDRVFVRTLGAGKTHLLVSDDAGRTWKKVFEASRAIAGVALTEDGSRVFVGAGDGVASSPTNAFAFVSGAPIEASCLSLSGSVLWSCSNEKSGFFLGASRNGGRAFDAKLHLEDLKGPLECPAESSLAKACAGEWEKIRAPLGVPDPDAKPRTGGSSGPAMYGRSERTRGSRSTLAGVAMLAAFGYLGYELVRWLQKRRRG